VDVWVAHSIVLVFWNKHVGFNEFEQLFIRFILHSWVCCQFLIRFLF